MGYAGESHDRSFDLSCSVYNTDTKQGHDFTVRCIFDNNARWRNFTIPRQGSLLHIAGELVGKFRMGDVEHPAILITGYRSLTGALTSESSPATPLAKSTGFPKIVPPGYRKPNTPSKTNSPKEIGTEHRRHQVGSVSILDLTSH